MNHLTGFMSMRLAEREQEGKYELTSGELHILACIHLACDEILYFCTVSKLATLKGGLNMSALYDALKKLTSLGLAERAIKGRAFKKGAYSYYCLTNSGRRFLKELENKQSTHHWEINKAVGNQRYEELVKVFDVKIVSMFQRHALHPFTTHIYAEQLRARLKK